MYYIAYAASQKYDEHSQHIQLDATIAQRRDEARTHLNTDGVDKEDETKLLYKVADFWVDGQTKVREHNADKQYPSDTQRYRAELNAVQQQSDGDSQSEHNHRSSDAVALKQFNQPFHIT